MSEQNQKETLSPFGYIKDGKVYRSAFNEHDDKEIGEVRESEEQSFQYFTDRYDRLKEKVDELENSVDEAVNKGSFLMKLLHMKDKMPEYKGIGDFSALIVRLEKLESSLQEKISENRVKNLEIKTALLKEAESLKDSQEWFETAEKMKELRLNWVRTGAVSDEKQEEMEETFHNTVNHFFEEKRKFNEAKKELIIERSKKYKTLIAELRKLMHERDKEVILKRVNEIKEEWEKIGEIPEKIMRSLEGKLVKSIQNLTHQKRRRRIHQNDDNRDSRGGGYGNDRRYQDRGQRGGYRNDGGGYRNNNRDRGSNYNRGPERSYDRGSSYNRNSGNSYEAVDDKMIEEKEKLLSMALELKDMPMAKAVDLAKELQDKWLKSGKSKAPEIRNIYNKFRESIALIFERNNLLKEVGRKNPGIESKTNTEQSIIQAALLKEFIKRDKTEIKLFEDNLNQNGVFDKEDDHSRMLVSKLRSQKYRIKIKETLLRDIELGQ